jgi:hypothetical protein
VSTPTPEEAFLEYARSTGWDETAVRVVLDTVRKARHAAALEMHERCRALEDALRACVEHCGRYVEREPHEAHFDSYDVDRDAASHSVERARKLLEEISAEK